jgi:3',5'-cyclic AMP phosphodiesterase CpdA
MANPQSWNRYSYVMNSPLQNLDAFGLSVSCDKQGNCHVDVWAPAPTSAYAYFYGIPHTPPPFCANDRGWPCTPGRLRKKRPTRKVNCHQLAAGQVPSNDFSTWWHSYVDASYMFDHWLAGTGPTNYDFGPDSPESREMMSARGLAQNVSNFLAGGASSGHQDFGARGYLSSGLNPTAQFVGSYDWSMSRSDGNLNITLTNPTDAWSFFLHAPGLDPNPPTRFDSVLNPGWHPMGRVNQTFHIQVPCP